MKIKFFIIAISLVCIIGLSVGVYALQEANIWDKIFSKDVDNITSDELKKAQNELLKLKLSPEEFKEYGNKLKNVIIEKEKKLPKTTQADPNLDTLIEEIKRIIVFIEERINYDQTINDNVRERQKEYVEALKNLLLLVETKEKSYEQYFSEYENLRLKYVEDYKRLRDQK